MFVWPPRPTAILRWLFGWPGLLLPWNLLYLAVALVLLLGLTPPLEMLREPAAGWILPILARNARVTLLFFGAWHLRLFVRRAQGTAFEFDARWPTTDSSVFLFRDRTKDNLFWTFASPPCRSGPPGRR